MLCTQPALYIHDQNVLQSVVAVLLYMYNMLKSIHLYTMINIIALNLYDVKPHACLSTLSLPEGKPYLVFPMHLPHVTKYMYDHTCCRSGTLSSQLLPPPPFTDRHYGCSDTRVSSRSCSKAGSVNHKSCVLAQMTFLEPFLCTHLVSNCVNDMQYIQ